MKGEAGSGPVRTGFGEEKLVDDDIVRVDLVRGEFLDEAFRLVQGQELGYADADERRLFLYVFVRDAVREHGEKTRRVTKGGGRTGSLNWVFTSVITARIDSSFENMSSVASAWPPMRLDICFFLFVRSVIEVRLGDGSRPD